MPRHAAPAAGPPGPAAANTPTRCGPPPQTSGAPPPTTGPEGQLAHSRPQWVSGDDQTSYGARRSGRSDTLAPRPTRPAPTVYRGGHPVAPARGSAHRVRSSLAPSDAGKDAPRPEPGALSTRPPAKKPVRPTLGRSGPGPCPSGTAAVVARESQLGFIVCTRRSAGAKQQKRPSTIQRDEHNTQEGFR